MHDVARPETMNAKVKSRRGMIFKAVLAVVGLFLILAGIKVMQIRKMMSSKPPMPVETVTSATVKEEDWAPTLNLRWKRFRRCKARWSRPNCRAWSAKIGFENGGVAKKGDLLMQLDASSEEAQLHSAEADLELAKADWERAADLVQAQSDFESGARRCGIEVQTEERGRRSDAIHDLEEDCARTVRWAARHSPGKRRADDQRRTAGGRVDLARSGFCRFRIAATESGAVVAGTRM